jgi:hypothetical protein
MVKIQIIELLIIILICINLFMVVFIFLDNSQEPKKYNAKSIFSNFTDEYYIEIFENEYIIPYYTKKTQQ